MNLRRAVYTTTLAALTRLPAASAAQNLTHNPLHGIQQFPLSFYSTYTNTTEAMAPLAPVISVSHGGGPMPLLGDPSQAALTHSMKTRVPKILKLGTAEQPRAIVLVTAHWSTDDVTISSAEKHELYYDYYGFPDEAYAIRYDAPGSPEVAEMVRRSLEEAGIKGKKDGTRGAYAKSDRRARPPCIGLLTGRRLGPRRLRAHETHPSSRNRPHCATLCALL